MNPGLLSGHFLGPPGRRVFLLRREPEGAARGSVLVVPPFGEEMNKSRHMIAGTAQRLCEAGLTVLVPDLFGTGDSEGEFRDAEVEHWIEDLGTACRHAEARGQPVNAILAVRFGCALAVAGLRRGVLPAVAISAWWQPVLDGKRHLAQFLRLRVAAGGMSGDGTETVEGLRERSAAGEVLSVAGYDLSPSLVAGIEALAVDALPPQAGELHWFEFVRESNSPPPLPATRFVDRARAAGAPVRLHALAAEPFWSSAELVRLPEVVQRTAQVLTRTTPAIPERRASSVPAHS